MIWDNFFSVLMLLFIRTLRIFVLREDIFVRFNFATLGINVKLDFANFDFSSCFLLLKISIYFRLIRLQMMDIKIYKLTIKLHEIEFMNFLYYIYFKRGP